jgi:hypothetical protein
LTRDYIAAVEKGERTGPLEEAASPLRRLRTD